MLDSFSFLRSARTRPIPAAAFVVAISPVAAQHTGTVSGTVDDNSNQVMPTASVPLTNEATGDTRTATSGAQRVSTFQAVPRSYTVKIERTGRTREQKKNVVNAGGRIDLGTVKLDVRRLIEAVPVVAERPRRTRQMSVRFSFSVSPFMRIHQDHSGSERKGDVRGRRVLVSQPVERSCAEQ
jgi:hypothetical protein